MLNGRLYNLSNILGQFRGCLNGKRRQGTFRYMLIEVCESLIRAFMVEAINLLVTIRTVKNQHDKPPLISPIYSTHFVNYSFEIKNYTHNHNHDHDNPNKHFNSGLSSLQVNST